MIILVYTLFVGSLLVLPYSYGQTSMLQALSRLHIQLFLQNKKLLESGQHMVAQMRMNIC